MQVQRKIRVLIVDDSAIVRKILTEELNRDEEIEVVGTATDPYAARDKILQLKPDVLTLDIEMPRMDGLTFLKILMKHHPMPIIIFSSLTQGGSNMAMQALQAGAVDVAAKPSGSFSVGEAGEQVVEKVKAAARARIRPSEAAQASAAAAKPAPTALVRPAAPSPLIPSATSLHPRQLLLLGASTGGTEALREVLTRLPRNIPGTCIVQHIPAYFSKAFADRLNTLCAFEVREAVDGDIVKPGLALVAPGGYHMVLHWRGGRHEVQLTQGPMVWHQRPAVDVMFDSAVECGSAAYSVAGLLTGMGKDGASGMLKLKQGKAPTYAQSEETCVVFGMPRAAMELDAVERMVPLDQFPSALNHAIGRLARRHMAPSV